MKTYCVTQAEREKRGEYLAVPQKQARTAMSDTDNTQEIIIKRSFKGVFLSQKSFITSLNSNKPIYIDKKVGKKL